MTNKIKNYIEEAEKELTVEFEHSGTCKLARYEGDTGCYCDIRKIKSFLTQKLRGLLEVIKDELPAEKEIEYYPQAYAATEYEYQNQQRSMGSNSYRAEVQKLFEEALSSNTEK
mgnify:CR=1 FL=1